MGLKTGFQERQALVEIERHLDTANHCLVRQLRALSRLGLHTSELGLGEALLRTMMETHQLFVQSQQQLEALPGSSNKKTKAMRAGHLKDAAWPPGSNSDSDQESTLLLRSKRLQPSD